MFLLLFVSSSLIVQPQHQTLWPWFAFVVMFLKCTTFRCDASIPENTINYGISLILLSHRFSHTNFVPEILTVTPETTRTKRSHPAWWPHVLLSRLSCDETTKPNLLIFYRVVCKKVMNELLTDCLLNLLPSDTTLQKQLSATTTTK